MKQVYAKVGSPTERRIHKILNHPNIVRFIDKTTKFSDEDVFTEKVNTDLSKYIEEIINNKIQIEEFLLFKWLNQIVSALLYLKKLKIVHGDIKPANIFLDKYLDIKLGDFGLSFYIDDAYKLQEESKIYKNYAPYGTPNYIAPELFIDRVFDYSNDIWSLGVLLYELRTLKLPHKCKTFEELKSFLSDTTNKIEFSDISFIDILISKMLQKDVSKRITIEELSILLTKRQIRTISEETHYDLEEYDSEDE